MTVLKMRSARGRSAARQSKVVSCRSTMQTSREPKCEGAMPRSACAFSRNLFLTRNKDGNVIDGNAERVTDITDIWTFTRDVSSRDPNWKLLATEAGQ